MEKENKPLSEKVYNEEVKLGISQFNDIQLGRRQNFRIDDVEQAVKDALHDILWGPRTSEHIEMVFKQNFGF